MPGLNLHRFWRFHSFDFSAAPCFSTHVLVFGYRDETLFLVLDICNNTEDKKQPEFSIQTILHFWQTLWTTFPLLLYGGFTV